MKRILIFSLSYLPKHVGGAEIAIKEITDRIPREEIEFHMVCLRFDSALPVVEQVGNVLVHRISFTRANTSRTDLSMWPLHLNKYLYQFYSVWVAHKLHRKYQYDGIWAIMAHSAGVPAALFKMLHPNVAYVQTLQEGDPPKQVERVARPVWPLFIRTFTTPTVIQAISTYLADWARRRGATCPVEVIPNGVDTARFAERPGDEALADVRNRLGRREGDVWLITTSRLVHKNAVDVVVRALPLLPEGVKFAVAGTGPEETTLRQLADELGVSSRVVFCGEVQHANVPAYLRACDMFIRPSRSEGMGNSFIEAMAAELPVIATHEGGIVDFLFDATRNPEKPTTGWAVCKDAPEDVVVAVQDILAHPDRVREVVCNARELVIRAYDWNMVARDMRARVFSCIS